MYGDRWFPIASWEDLPASARDIVDPNWRLDRALIKLPNGTYSVVHGTDSLAFAFGYFSMHGGIVCPD